MASQMVPAVYDTVTVDVKADRYGLKAVGSHLKFAGFMMLYSESKDKKETNKDITLPPLEVGQKLEAEKFEPKQHFTEPPPRYTEASLVKALEEKGIGRPSTYSPTIETILSRGYVDKEDKKFVPTELGFVVTDLLKEYFLDIVDKEFLQNFFQYVRHIIYLLAEHIKILAVNGSYERLCKRFVHLVLFAVCLMLEIVHFFKHLIDLFGIVVLKTLNEIVCCLLGDRGAFGKVFKIEFIIFCHVFCSFQYM